MQPQPISTLLIVTAILFVAAVASEVFVDAYMRPSSLFGYLLITTLISGYLSTFATEKINARILG
jgi:antibiotic biosynthesis monooxygenase (ABM) superfamily enzyme